ncbi:MAG: ROK family glucokinase [Actinobacteria bacterium]|nr:ROK family glucokinase [Actinomycetota bacterium]
MSLALGIDVGGTKVLGGVVDPSGKILKSARKQTPNEGGSALTETIAGLARELISEFDVSAVGVSAAGFISSDRKTMLATPNIVGWNGVDLTEQLERKIARRVVLENDANSAAWGEKKFGAGKDFHTVIMLTVGTGLGGGLIVNDQLYRGAYGIGAEFGHTRAVPNGHLCGCGVRGCFEQYASGNALLRHAREAIAASPGLARSLLSRGNSSIEGLTGKHLSDAASDGDSLAIAAFNTTGKWLGALCASLVAALDPQAFIVGGGVIDAGDILLDPARQAMNDLIPFTGKRPAPVIVPALLGNDAGLVGVADLARS